MKPMRGVITIVAALIGLMIALLLSEGEATRDYALEANAGEGNGESGPGMAIAEDRFLESRLRPKSGRVPGVGANKTRPDQSSNGVVGDTPVEVQIDLGQVLESFRSMEPDVDALKELFEELGASAVVSEESIVHEPHLGRVTGSFASTSTGIDGQFSIADEALSISLFRPGDKNTPYETQEASLRFRVSPGGDILDGTMVVNQFFDIRKEGTLDHFQERSIVGWVVNSSLEEGSTAKPVLGLATGSSLEIGVDRTGEHVPSLVREWDYDLSHFRVWRDLLSPYADSK